MPYSQARAAAAAFKEVEALQKNWRMLLAAGVSTPSPADKLKLGKDDWRKRLDKTQYNVLREEGTERAGTSPLDSEKRAGVYACVGCDLPLFTSDMKFDSGTGWRAFLTTIPGFRNQKDHHLPTRGPSILHTMGGPLGYLRRRSKADWPAILQQRRGAEIHTEKRQSLIRTRPAQSLL